MTARTTAWGAVAGLILVPLLAGLIAGEVTWDAATFPYAFVGILLVVAGGTYELAARVPADKAYRAAVAVALAAAFVLIWMNGAVGIIGNEENPLNLMYGGVLAAGLAGAAIARFKANGMARAMVAAALAQGLVALLPQIAGHFTWILTGFFIALWLISAWLFHRAALEQAQTRSRLAAF